MFIGSCMCLFCRRAIILPYIIGQGGLDFLMHFVSDKPGVNNYNKGLNAWMSEESGHQIGNDGRTSSRVRKNIDMMCYEMNNLNIVKVIVMRRVAYAESRQMYRTTAVVRWLEKVAAKENQVHVITQEFDQLLQKGCLAGCGLKNLKSWSNLSRKVRATLQDIIRLKEEDDFDVVAQGLHTDPDQRRFDPPRRSGGSMSSGMQNKIVRHVRNTQLVAEKGKPIIFSAKQLQTITWNFTKHLGSGGQAAVYKGELHDGVQVAVKLLRDVASNRAVECLTTEVSTLWTVHHVNIVRLYGFCSDANMKAFVYEYMVNESLDRILFSSHQTLEWEKLYNIALGVAQGLSFLHEEFQLIHNDIKPANILLDFDCAPKISGFELAQTSDEERTEIRGTLVYMAPERWNSYSITCKCDVFSYGMMLFEIVGRRRNSDNISQNWLPLEVWEKAEKGELDKLLTERGIAEKDREQAKIMSAVALWCIQYKPEDRPSMSTVVEILEGQREVEKPSNPFPHLTFSGLGPEEHISSELYPEHDGR